MQWSIGFSRGDIGQVIKDKNCSLQFKWLPLNDNAQSIADPFIFKDQQGNMHLLYEDFSMVDTSRYGKIIHAKVNADLSVSGQKELLDPGSHTSYPFVFAENGTTYIIPETSEQKNTFRYEFNFDQQTISNQQVMLGKLPLLDSTIFIHDGKYWLFATQSDPEEFEHSRLYIYFADSFSGPYNPHAKNPVKENMDGSRPAGNVIKVAGDVYRPSQNCSIHYGESLSINKILKLSETEFEEELSFKIKPDARSEYSAGVHTINVVDDVIVIDGIKMKFAPVTKWTLFIKKKISGK